jgi:FkbM family methyltransferase
MDTNELDARNRAALAAIAAARARGETIGVDDAPYFGYVTIDLFECPPFVMFTNYDAPNVSHVLYDRQFEPTSMRLWCRLCKSATSMVDLGANIGIYSLAAASLRKDIPIHAFEPNPYAYTRLRMHKHVNGFGNIVEHPVAVANQAGIFTLTFVVKAHGLISSGAALAPFDRADVEKLPVRTVTLDGIGLAASLGARPVLKVDVEGLELAVFKSMDSILALKPDIILETFEPAACNAINTRLLPMGYRVYRVEERAGHLVPVEGLAPRSALDKDDGLNHFLTIRPAAEIDALMA